MADAPKTKELNYVMVQNMGYDAETRTLRHLRPGQRRTRFLLDNGRRIRDKGDRYTEVTFEDVLSNFNLLLGGIQTGAIQVCRPDNLEAFSLGQFVDLGKRLAEDFRKDLKVDETLLEPLVGSDLKDRQVWVAKPKADVVPAAKPGPDPIAAVAPLEVKAELPKAAEAPKEELAAKTEESKHHMKKGRR